jgi:hypothetical protein
MTTPPSIDGYTYRGLQMSISGSPDVDDSMPLYVGPSESDNEDLELFISGPAANSIPLFISTLENPASGTAILYINGSLGTTASGMQGTLTLVMGRGIDGADDSQSWPLYINGPAFDTDEEDWTLYIAASTDRDSNSQLQLFTEGGTPTSLNPERADSSTSLFVRNAAGTQDNTSLYVDKDFNSSSFASLFVKSTQASGDITLFLDGKVITTESMDMFVKGPTNTTIPLYIPAYQSN